MQIYKKHRFKLNSPQRSKAQWLWGLPALLLLAAGLYLLTLILAPLMTTPGVTIPGLGSAWNKPVVHKNQIEENRLYIPRLKLNIPYASGGPGVLDDNAWHRYPENGDPQNGGNFVLAGHRFEIGLTPGETRKKSPFYHINKIQVGDYIYADFNAKRYQYEVTRKYEVKPTQTEIESRSATSIMTLYTCTLKGEADGREVLEARLVAKDVEPADELTVSANEPSPPLGR